MKRVLITGKNSYIGTSLENWLMREPDKYKVDTVDMKDGSWKEMDFSKYDVVFHVAGIAHIKESKNNAEQYYKVNRDLAYETAYKAKSEGIAQFIFLSSMSVYGLEEGVIRHDTPLNPKSNYGRSKLQAEELITGIGSTSFKVAILRPPLVYGKGCKGNYPKLVRFALKLPLFPNIKNERSMIYIDNLCEFIRLIIENEKSGIHLPQNEEYVCTSDLVKLVAEAHGKKIWMTKLFNPIIKKIKLNTVNKVFCNLVYGQELSRFDKGYSVCSFVDSIKNTEVK